MSRYRIGIAIVLLGVIAFASACRRSSPDEIAEDHLSSFAKLSLTLKTQDSDLQNELARIRSENGLPEQLQRVEDSVDPDHDLTSHFKAAFESDWQLESLSDSLSRKWPSRSLDLGEHRVDLLSLLSSHESRRDTMRKALKEPGARFHLDFTKGMAADTLWLDAAEILARLEAIEASERIDKSRAVAAIENVQIQLLLADKLAECSLLTARLQAVEVRRLALLAIKSIASAKDVSEATREKLAGLLADQLASWPKESSAWLGDRAIGLHTYEMVRAGEYQSLLNEEELRELEAKGELVDRIHVVKMNVDRDENYYLTTIRELLHQTDQPYYQRADVWLKTMEELESGRYSKGFPRVAADLMMPGMISAQQRLSRDRTRVEVWQLALRASLGDASTTSLKHGVTGNQIQVKRDPNGTITVLGLEPLDGALVPILRPIGQTP